ncbi:MAG: AAA family ATPase, partial [Candidatus Sungiibacteriota bacterium]
MSIGNKFLIAFIGPVGSGKTYIARILARKLGAVHVRADDIRVALRRRGKAASISTVRKIGAEKREEGFRRGKSVVSDFDAVHTRRRRELARFAKRYGAKAVFIKVETSE